MPVFEHKTSLQSRWDFFRTKGDLELFDLLVNVPFKVQERYKKLFSYSDKDPRYEVPSIERP
jgi:hypothetical protein